MKAVFAVITFAAIVAVAGGAVTLLTPPEDSPEEVQPEGGDPGIDQEGQEDSETMTSIIMTANGREFTIVLEDTAAAKAFAGMLPAEIRMSELNGNEKYHYLDTSLPTSSQRPGTINAGDVMLYGSDCIVVFYETFRTSYSYTPIGHIADADGLAEALGPGSVTVAFSQAPSAGATE